MEIFDLVFYVFAVLIVVSAAGVVFSKNVMHSAFSLLFTFFGVAGLYVLLLADFIAVTQIMIYIGGILILIIFGVMLTSRIASVDIKSGATGKFQTGLAAIVTLVVFVTLCTMYMNAQWVIKEVPAVSSTISMIGKVLLTDYLLAFEVAAILLLVAFIGAALIARREK
jgi:NADH-quinone oxidoreductase subunit J